MPPTARPHGRGAPPTGLPIERHPRPLTADERRCPCCGGEVEVFGHEPGWSIDDRPGALVVVLYECEKGACPRCPDGGVAQATAPAKPVPGGEPGPGLLARLLVDKGDEALPLQRQGTRLAREGLVVPETTLQGWWDAAADLLTPLVTRLLDTVLAQPVLILDGTRLPVLDRDHPKGLRQGTTWPVVARGVGVVFTYEPSHPQGLDALFTRLGVLRTPGPEGEPPKVVEPPRLVVDGEAAIAHRIAQAGLPPPQLSGMHARRAFKRAFDAGDTRAVVPLAWFRTRFAREHQADVAGLDAAGRQALRQRASAPVLEALRVWALALQPTVAPRTPLGKALTDLAARWLTLCVYLHDGQIPFDPGEVERRIRRLAVGRHAYLFAGSDDGARRLCRVLSLCGSCRLLGLEPWAYVRDVLTQLAAGAAGAALDALLPAAWQKQHAQQAQQPDPAPS
jgi:transposase